MNKISSISILLLAFLLTFWGCSDSSVNEPEISKTSVSLNKFPHQEQPNILNEISVSKKINGRQGGKIILNGSYKNSDGRVITVHAYLTIPRNAFQGTAIFKISSDPQLAALKFEPAMKFDIPLDLNLVLTNVDLVALDLTQDVKFVFMGDDGIIEPTKNDGVKVNLANGALIILNAKLEHFSRYGFTR